MSYIPMYVSIKYSIIRKIKFFNYHLAFSHYSFLHRLQCLLRLLAAQEYGLTDFSGVYT